MICLAYHPVGACYSLGKLVRSKFSNITVLHHFISRRSWLSSGYSINGFLWHTYIVRWQCQKSSGPNCERRLNFYIGYHRVQTSTPSRILECSWEVPGKVKCLIINTRPWGKLLQLDSNTYPNSTKCLEIMHVRNQHEYLNAFQTLPCHYTSIYSHWS